MGKHGTNYDEMYAPAAAEVGAFGYLTHCESCGTLSDRERCDCTEMKTGTRKAVPFTLEDYRQSIAAHEATTIECCAQVTKEYIESLLDPKSETMSHWDQIRAQCENYKGSDLPRLNFESLIETIAEDAAAAIRALKDKP